MSINITNERKVPYAVFDVDLSTQEASALREIGWREIQKDDEALIQYAMEYVLRQFVGDLENNVAKLEELVKNDKLLKKVKKVKKAKKA